MSELYDNLLKATSNLDDITTERYATVTKLNGNYCDVKEEEAGLEHTNVPIVNGANLSVGDKVIIGFLNNSIYDVVCYGALDKTVHDDSKQDTLISGTNIKTINNTSLLGSGNINIQGGGTVTVDDSLSTTSTNPVQNKVITSALNGKANSSHAHLSSDVTDLIDVIYPVGSIYMSVNSTNPSIIFGGTWEQIKDTFLLASGDTYANGSTGGSADAVIVSHSHTCANQGEYIVTSEETSANNTRVAYSANGNRWVDGQTSKSNFHHRASTSTVGEDGTGKNMPPYLAVNVWKRTA